MEITAMTLIVAAWSGTLPAPTIRTVRVCIDGGFNGEGEAKQIASQMFLAAGVKLEWHRGLDHRACPAGAIQISVTNRTNPNLLPNALAYALPFEGTHIRVFYDRIQERARVFTVPRLLAHVLVHEITHILQGTSAHSDTGVMKARWNGFDFSDMARNPLPFTDHDIMMIHRGLEAREMGRTPVQLAGLGHGLE
jgi:hypothetical protein